MKIGLLTYHWVPNFGAQMQTFASVLRLRAMGHEPVVLDWRPADTESRYTKSIPTCQLEQHRKFMEERFPLSPLCRTAKEIETVVREMGVAGVLVGSDSLFNLMRPRFSVRRFRWIFPTSDHVFPNPFWMPSQGEGRVPYAALSVSSQNADYGRFRAQKKDIGDALRRFCFVSVRDVWTRDLVSFFTDGAVVPPVTPDPVFAMERNGFAFPSKAEILKRFQLPERYALLSFFGGVRTSARAVWQKELLRLWRAEGVEGVEFPRASGGQRLETALRIPLPLDPLDWYALIRHSTAYVGMLMHPVIVALHNAVPCFSFDHYGVARGVHLDATSSKIHLLLNEVGLVANRHPVSRVLDWPAPARVIERLHAFDKQDIRERMDVRAAVCVQNYEVAVKALESGGP